MMSAYGDARHSSIHDDGLHALETQATIVRESDVRGVASTAFFVSPAPVALGRSVHGVLGTIHFPPKVADIVSNAQRRRSKE